MLMFTLAFSFLTTFNLPWFMDLTFQVPMQYCSPPASDFTSITSHIHNCVLFSLWLHLFILSGVHSFFIVSFSLHSFFSSSILGTSSFSVLSFCLFILFMGFSRQEYWSGLPFPSLLDHIFSELSPMTHPSWVALHGIAHSFIELDKALIHVIRLVSFLWLFSICLPSDGEVWEAYGSFLMGEIDCMGNWVLFWPCSINI